MEEEYWRQRGRQNWLLQGDANTAFFHAYANGRKRKCTIFQLETSQGVISSPALIQQHIYEFYISLMGSEEPKLLSLSHQPWGADRMISNAENEDLALTFTLEELEECLKATKSNTAPGLMKARAEI